MPDSEELQVAYAPLNDDYTREAEIVKQRVEELEARLKQEEEDNYLDRLAAETHPTNVEKGFWGPPEMMDKYVAKLALIHSEVTEVLEALRKGQGADKVTEEFADIHIRMNDLYHVLVEEGLASPRLSKVIRKKMKANAERPPKHGHVWG